MLCMTAAAQACFSHRPGGILWSFLALRSEDGHAPLSGT